MSPLGSIGPVNPGILQRIEPGLPNPGMSPAAPRDTTPGPGFSEMLAGVVAVVDSKQQASAALTRQVLLGQTDQLHQSVIAMQEAGVAFSLMVEVRNKLVESYQELMRMQV